MNSQRSRRRLRVTLTLLVVGLGCAAAGIYGELRVQNQLTETEGRIVATRANRARDYWHVAVDFDFALQGKQHRQSESRLLRESYQTEAEALAALDARPGQRVVVYVDPSHPEGASLSRAARSFRFFAASGALWMTLALCWFWYDRHERQRR